MPNSGTFIAGRNWEAVTLDGEEIRSGLFIIINTTPNPIAFIQSATPPSQGDSPVLVMQDQNEQFNFDLGPLDRLFTKSLRGPLKIGVVQTLPP